MLGIIGFILGFAVSAALARLAQLLQLINKFKFINVELPTILKAFVQSIE